MANALKTLFTDIATSIRGGLPDEGAMSPYSFPEKIDEIVASIGAGGSGGSSDGIGLTCLTKDATLTKSAVYEGNISGYVRVKLPKDAVFLGSSIVIRFQAKNSGGTSLGTSGFIVKHVTPGDIEEVSTSYGITTYNVLQYEWSYTGAYMIASDTTDIMTIYKMPNVSLTDGILLAHENCEALFASESYADNGVLNPYYINEIDMRGSNAKSIGSYALCNHTELKKVWFSEVCEYITKEMLYGCWPALEELHFTSETPPKLGYKPFADLNTACKIYVPAGTLDAYTGTTYYPSASTYTYIEE